MAASCMDSVKNTLYLFQRFGERIDGFLTNQNEVAEELKQSTKSLYDLAKKSEDVLKNQRSNSLPELIVEKFDDEQIWQQLEIQNEECTQRLIETAARLLARKNLVSLVENAHDDGENNRQDGDEDFPEESEELAFDDSGSDSDAMDEKLQKMLPIKEKKTKPMKTKKEPLKITISIVDDRFFKLSEMENFLNIEDAREERLRDNKDGDTSDSDDSEESVDLFDGQDDEEEDEENEVARGEQDIHFADFFDPPRSNVEPNLTDASVLEDEDGDEDDEHEDEDEDGNELEQLEDAVDFDTRDVSDAEGSEEKQEAVQSDSESEREELDEIKSAFEKRQEKMKKLVESMEEENLGDKPWQLKGEILGHARPENSLLEEHLQFEHMSRPAPDVTEETTHGIESIIKQRIKDKIWDDVERKAKPVENPFEFKKRVVLDQEKSKLSLAQVYEKEYLKQQENAVPEDQEFPEHTEIKKKMSELFQKLDALSNYHFLPRPRAPDIKIISNLPAITVEEVAPATTSDATLLAPEEVKGKLKGEMKGKSERTATDRKRERRLKKARQAKRPFQKADKEAKLKTDVKGGKRKSGLASSSNFFAKLQDEVTNQVQSKIAEKKRKQDKPAFNAKKLKL